MKIIFVQTGKTTEHHIAQGVALYEARVKRFISFDTVTMQALKNIGSLTPDEVKKREGAQLLNWLPVDSFVILLDEKGKEFSTVEFATFMRRTISNLRKNIVFVSGGAWGFAPEVYDRADMKLSLSRLTFPHQLVRLLFMEQLYRVFSLIEGNPYHHE